MPWRSGSPQGVRGAVQFLAPAASVRSARGAWAKADSGDNIAAVLAMMKKRLFMAPHGPPAGERLEQHFDHVIGGNAPAVVGQRVSVRRIESPMRWNAS